MGRTEQNGQDASLRIADRYRLVEKLGTGGMSVVWRGYDETLGRSVAVKVLSPRLADDRAFRDRLRQEALAAARLSHPHITGIFDFGESPLNKNLTVPYVVMELNDGESVSARVTRQGPLPWREAVTMAAEVASALATAHARGVVHRDVTPANVMLTAAGAKVVDFGISAIVGERDAAPDGSLLGTPAYLAPERLAGAQVSAATDIYALGLLLYRALTGRLPWPAETTAEALRAHLYADPAPLPTEPGLPDEIAALCLSCLAKNPLDRPAAATAARSLAATVGVQPLLPALRARPEGAPLPVRGAATASDTSAVSNEAHAAVAPRPRPNTLAGLRLRAGLKVGGWLRLGDARPLGGGLFAGGGLIRVLAPARGAADLGVAGPSGRHRLQAALLTAGLLMTAGVGWAATRESRDVEQAQAAGAGPAAAGPMTSPCAVRYQLKTDSGRHYEALLTVVTTDEVGRSSWRVVFAYPGSQRLTGAPKAVTQTGRKVTAKGHGTLKTFTLRGAYRGYNPLPLAFSLDGRRCRAEVVASTATRTEGEPVSEAAGADNPRNAGGDLPKRTRPPRKSSSPRKRNHHSHQVTPPPAMPPLSPPPTARKGNGLSLAW
ncbi:serine/threonine-protein kinase [Actinoplanes sp. CA-030573]|uniref:serine/threonine-protein kinase n=1 Tax=Actinoplanes sp. CA-030573 TaxID=3239898 RepID=UPI003D907052